MPRSPVSKGRCFLCKKDLGIGAMNTHLKKEHLSVASGDTPYYLLKVESYYSKDYWFYAHVKAEATLQDLDIFLRAIWLECCGHLSAFHIGEQDYDVSVENEDDDDWNDFIDSDSLPMNEALLRDVAEPGLSFTYEYDFGSPTTLKLTVIDIYQGQHTKDDVVLLARNLPILHECSKCGKRAIYVDVDSMWDDPLYFCATCGKKMEKNEEVNLLLISNSPRMGVCAYDGELDQYGVEDVPRMFRMK